MQFLKNNHGLPLGASKANSWYHHSAQKPKLLNCQFEAGQNFEVAIIGAGLTGLGAALRLAKAGINVAVFEQGEIGAGASGRNGGLLCTGYRHEQAWFEEKMGFAAANELWEIAEAAKIHLSNLIEEHKIDADLKFGFVTAAHKPKMAEWLESDAAHMAKNYNYQNFRVLSKSEISDALGTNAYFGGIIDAGAGRLHPLKLLYGLGSAAQNNGAIIFENNRVLAIKENAQKVIIKTQKGDCTAQKLILCGDGYLHGIDSQVEAKVMPIYSFVLATEPLKSAEIMKSAVAGADTRFVLNYFQKTNDNRLIFGGGEKYDASWPIDVKQFVSQNLLKIFPQLENTEITHAWGGALGITPSRLPLVRKTSKRVLVAAGYSGQGVLLAPFFGNILGEMLLGDDAKFNMISKMPVSSFPGGRYFRFAVLSAAMSYYSILDKLP